MGKNHRDRSSSWRSLLPFKWKKEVTQEELETIIDTGQEKGLLDEDENEMIHRIFEMKDIVVREVMVPRTDIEALEVSSSVEDVAQLVVKVGHSRIPVYEDNIDRIVGIVYAKDLLKYWISKSKNSKIKDVMRKPLFVPETKNIDDLFKELKSQRIHIAIVVDEYGGTAGLVTIEDLIEEIVGDIQDEYDIEEEEFVAVGEGEYVADARIDIDELSDKLGVTISKEDYDTLGGFLVHVSNKIPAIDDVIRYEDIMFTIIEADERRVAKVGIKMKPAEEKDTNLQNAREE